MSETTPLRRRASPLAIAALVTGVVPVAIFVSAVIWTAPMDGETGFSAGVFVWMSIGAVALIGVVVGITAVARHCKPGWMVAVGLVINIPALLFTVGLLVGLSQMGSYLDTY